MENRVFFPQSVVDQWAVDGKVDLMAGELILLAEDRRYKVEEAVRVVAEVTGASDDRKIVGKVRSKTALVEIGAELLETSMILGDNAYDVVPGWLAVPTTPLADHLASPERTKARAGKSEAGPGPQSEEELLGRFVEGKL